MEHSWRKRRATNIPARPGPVNHTLKAQRNLPAKNHHKRTTQGSGAHHKGGGVGIHCKQFSKSEKIATPLPKSYFGTSWITSTRYNEIEHFLSSKIRENSNFIASRSKTLLKRWSNGTFVTKKESHEHPRKHRFLSNFAPDVRSVESQTVGPQTKCQKFKSTKVHFFASGNIYTGQTF